jgi:hypothetical protein
MISNRRSTPSLCGSSNLALAIDDDAANGRHSLAHELAVALMPEPSAGSKLLAEEFGIEYDEGAEGIDEIPEISPIQNVVPDNGLDELGPSRPQDESHETQVSLDYVSSDCDPDFGTPVPHSRWKTPLEQDAMEILAQNLVSTDKFLAHLRRLDVDSSHLPALETIASDVIRRINDTARDREGQVRELLGYEREFRRIAGEVGGSDVLGQLDELLHEDDLFEQPPCGEALRPDGQQLDSIEEEQLYPPSGSNDWEMDPDRHRLGDEDEQPDDDISLSPVKDSFLSPPPVNGPATLAKTIPQLAHLRSFTTSLVASLTTISEQAQVNGVATTEAGRKIRALKNKMGGWQTEWDSAERSRIRIEKWEAGVVEGDMHNGVLITPTRSSGAKRVDGRKLVEEHLQGFDRALADAAMKTKAIMAVS